MLFPREIQKFISSYMIFGMIPLDKTLHFLIGAFLTIVLKKASFKTLTIFLIIGMLGIVKEILDSFSLSSTPLEHCLDFATNFIYPLLALLVGWIKSKTAKR